MSTARSQKTMNRAKQAHEHLKIRIIVNNKVHVGSIQQLKSNIFE
jgi:hypothetical protein